MSEYTDKEIATYFAERDAAEVDGLYDTIENPRGLPMTPEQEMALAQAMSTLSDLAKETNSSLSDFLSRYAK